MNNYIFSDIILAILEKNDKRCNLYMADFLSDNIFQIPTFSRFCLSCCMISTQRNAMHQPFPSRSMT